jgi:hypothetical protein
LKEMSCGHFAVTRMNQEADAGARVSHWFETAPQLDQSPPCISCKADRQQATRKGQSHGKTSEKAAI